MMNMFFQMGVGMLVGSFFSGFITLRLPFSLTERFKVITQQGVNVPGLDSSYVSTSSWYYTALFGLSTAAFRLFSRSTASSMEEQAAQQAQMGLAVGMQQQPQQGFMGKTLFNQEVEAHKIADWAPTPLLLSERELLKRAAALGLGGGRPPSAGGGGSGGAQVANPALKKES